MHDALPNNGLIAHSTALEAAGLAGRTININLRDLRTNPGRAGICDRVLHLASGRVDGRIQQPASSIGNGDGVDSMN
jgi:hypothetical protein